jgi:hypothetical protein
MQQSLRAIQIASRVLTDLGDRKEPDPADVAELRRLDPLLSDMPLDELACDVIQQALKRRAELKAKGGAIT